MQISERERRFGKKARASLAAGVLFASGVAIDIGGGVLPKILTSESTQAETYTSQTSSILVDSEGRVVAQEGPNQQVFEASEKPTQERHNSPLETTGIILVSIAGTSTALSGLRKVIPDKK